MIRNIKQTAPILRAPLGTTHGIARLLQLLSAMVEGQLPQVLPPIQAPLRPGQGACRPPIPPRGPAPVCIYHHMSHHHIALYFFSLKIFVGN